MKRAVGFRKKIGKIRKKKTINDIRFLENNEKSIHGFSCCRYFEKLSNGSFFVGRPLSLPRQRGGHGQSMQGVSLISPAALLLGAERGQHAEKLPVNFPAQINVCHMTSRDTLP